VTAYFVDKGVGFEVEYGRRGYNMPKLMEVLEFLDDTGQVMVRRLPETGDTEIKWGAQLTVRQSQTAVFFADGKVHDVFGPGRYVLETKNIPILTKTLTRLGYGPQSPFRAEVCFVSMKLFRNMKWGTKEPILYRDSQFGMVRLRSFGIFSVRVKDSNLFVNDIVGTQNLFATEEIEDYLRGIIIAKFADLLGSSMKTVLDLPEKYDELAEAMKTRLVEDFNSKGLELVDYYVNSISLPPEVEQVIDEKAGMNAIGNINTYLQFKAARAMGDAAKQEGGNASAGIGMGAGVGMGLIFPGLIQNAMASGMKPAAGACASCGATIPTSARFCPACGASLETGAVCQSCKSQIPAGAKFCPNCGNKTSQ